MGDHVLAERTKLTIDARVALESIVGEGLAAPTVASLPLPALIRRNATLLTCAEAFVGTGQQMVPTLGAVMVMHLTGSAALAGIGGSVLGLSRALVSYPSGRLADLYGRKSVLVVGLLLSLMGALGLGVSMLRMSFPAFLIALLVFGIGNGTSQQQRRLSAADLYPPERRAQGLGYVLTGSLVGAVGGPMLISVAGALTHGDSMNQIALSWFLVPLMLIPSLELILLIRPDPRDIAMDLARYWPGYRAPSAAPKSAARITLLTFARNYPHQVAFASMFVLFGNMSMMMALAPMTMTADGMPLSAISMTVALHVVGMYGLSMPIGKFADRFGRRPVLFTGVALSTFGTLLVALSHAFLPVVIGLFIIGVGWCSGNVATAAMVADTTPAPIRGRAMGANSSFSAVSSVAAPLMGGVLVQLWGSGALVAITLLFMMPATALLMGLRETAPGMYAHETTF